MNERDLEERPAADPPRRPERATYRTPVIVEFGDVRELTNGSGGTKHDATTPHI